MVSRLEPYGYTSTVQVEQQNTSGVESIQAVSAESLSATRPESLHGVLRVKMKAIHLKAMQNSFLMGLQNGQMCSKAYVVYLCNLYHLHAALERAQERIDATFVFRELFRSAKLLKDIKIWSNFNDTESLFSDLETDSPEFLAHVDQFVQPCVRDFVLHLDKQNDSMAIVGTMFALYGTIMAGGQQVKEGVKKAFIQRLEEHLIDEDDLRENHFIKRFITAAASPIVKEGVLLFSFEQEGFNMNEFKQTWHQALNAIPNAFRNRELIGDECVAGIQIVLDAIASLEKEVSKM